MKQRVVGWFRALGLHLGGFFALLTVLWLLLSAAAALPNEALQKNFETSAVYYMQHEVFPLNEGDHRSGMGDHYADMIQINVAWHMGNGCPLTSSLNTRYYDGEEMGENFGLYASVTREAEPNHDYTRYWHGNTMVLRWLHLLTDVNGIMLLGFFTLLLLVALTAGILCRKGHVDLAVLLLVALVAVRFWNMRWSLEFQPAFLLTFLLCPFYLYWERKGNRGLALLSTLGGTLTAFFDFLTTETMTILIPLLLVIAVRVKEGRAEPVGKLFGHVAVCGVCWGGAYGASFLVKWVLAGLVTGENLIAVALTAMSKQINVAASSYTIVPPHPISPLLTNLSTLFGGSEREDPKRALIGTAAVLALCLLAVLLFKKKKKKPVAATLVLLLLGALVPLRFLLLSNHSYVHDFFTHRALCSTVLSLLLAVWLNLRWSEKRIMGKRSIKRKKEGPHPIKKRRTASWR